MPRSVELDAHFTGIPIMKLGRKAMTYSDLNADEEATVRRVYRDGVRHIGYRSPKFASILAPQEEEYVKWSGIAKAEMDDQPLANPGGPGKVLVDWIIPENIEVSSSGTSSYAGWTINTWNVSLTAATAFYILGTSTAANSYKTINTAGSEFGFLIAKDGIVELGVVPSFTALRCISDADSQYTCWCMPPLHTMPCEDGKAIYFINTPAMIPAWSDIGIHLYGMPRTTATATFNLAGLEWIQYTAFSIPVTRS
jgi:hypothetical protein